MSDGSIAIVGASCRFPGAENLEEFWRLLASAGDAVSEVDPGRWSTRFYFHPARGEPGKSYTWSAGLITGVDMFEPAFFGISPRESVQMDPQQRLLLELVWHALEDAGITASRLSGRNIGVFVGASTRDYSDLRLGDPAGADAYFMIGNTLSILANRISYIFDLRGPSLAIDTACSSSLVAFHQACEALRDQRIESAIVGGINLLLSPYPFLGFCRASMLSRQGRCYAFDERADGYVRGEGGGVVILKPLATALADGDPVRAVVLGSGVNSDGRTIGLSLPSEEAQAALLESVYGAAGVTPDSVAFFEMHGTGTPVGDPIEAAAVGRALGKNRSKRLPIGSVKTNIGHLEPASGMAGLLKAALALERQILPPTLHCERPNPQIPFETLNLRLASSAEQIAATGTAPRAGVNAFGFGGTNAHVILEAPPQPPADPPAEKPLPPLLMSARSEAALRELARDWRSRLIETPPKRLPAALRAAARRRDHHVHRLVVLGQEPATGIQSLTEFLDGVTSPTVIAGTAVAEGGLAFVFSGNGAQFAGMGQETLRSSAAFRAAMAKVDEALSPELGWSVSKRLEAGVDDEQVARADIAQPLLFAIQVAAVEALRDCGVVASGYFGHSVGEIAAAWAAGALSLADAAKVVLWRSHHQQRTRGKGRMAALALAQDKARELLAELDSRAEIAAFNGTHALTVSGPNLEIERLESETRRRGLWFRALDLDFAFHSREMDAIREDLLANLRDVSSCPPSAMMVSTVTGAVVDGEILGAEHWWHNIRHPVRFAEAAAHLIGEGYRIFVEIGPSAILQSYLRDALRAADVDGRAIASLSRASNGEDPFPAIAARCHAAGYDLGAAPIFEGATDPQGVPRYPWQRSRFWFAETSEAINLVNPPFDHPLLGYRQTGPLACWVNHLDENILPWIADHAIEGVAVFPAAAIIETALAAARCRWPDARALEAFDLELRRPLPFDTGRMRTFRTTVGTEDGEWELASGPRLSTEPMTVHAVGRIAAATEATPILTGNARLPAGTELDGETVYRLARDAGLEYGRQFRTVERVAVTGGGSALVDLDPSAIDGPLDQYLLHPALLDGALQGLIVLLAEARREPAGVALLPWRFKQIRLLAPFARVPRVARLQLTRIGVRSVSADVVLCDASGEVVAELVECWLRRVDLARRSSPEDRMLRVDLVPSPLIEPDGCGLFDRVGALAQRFAGSYAAAGERRDEAPLLEALVGTIGLGAARRLVHHANRPFALDGLVDSGRLSPASTGLAERLLQLLGRLGAAAEAGPEWRLEPAEDLPEPSQIWRLLLADAPDLAAELVLAATSVDSLPKALFDGPRPQPPSLSPAIDHLLHASPGSVAGVTLLCDAIEAIAATWPKGRSLRILELGARGGATRRVLDRLAHSLVPITYLATATDPDLVAGLALLGNACAGASACQWSPSDGSEPLRGARFDLIIASNACARSQLDVATLHELAGLLAPDGAFLATEPEPNAFWDVVFGQAESWWSKDGTSPLRTGDEWQNLLAAAGFKACGSAPLTAAPWPSAVVWGGAPGRKEPGLRNLPKPRSLTLIAEDSATATALQDQLTATGHTVSRERDLLLDLSTSDTGDDRSSEIILLTGDAPDDSEGSVERAAKLLAAMARLAQRAAERQARLWVVTRGAQQTGSSAVGTAAVGAALWGMARVLINETPGLSVRMIDVHTAASAAECARQIADEFSADTQENEVVLMLQGRHVPRLRKGLPPRWAAQADLLGLSADSPGGIDSLDWEIRTPPAVKPGEVEIDVRAAGLNFRDMMWAMDLLPEEALIDGFAGPALGLECAGVVRALGSAVEGLAVGDRVMAFAPAALSSRVVTTSDAVVRLPDGTSFAAAATIPVAFVTAIYALGHLAKLMPGEHVLIHSAAGGVGLAAIQYAKHRGAVVTATAGSDAKRAFLRLAGADHVLDSRSLAFADAIREITGGAGVDVVLNSLSGEAMERSLELLKPFGRFLELGKRDFYLNRRFHLRPLRQNISYFAIDIDQLPVRRPDLARTLLAEIVAALTNSEIRPLAHRIFSFAEIDDAFRLMQSSGHIGKLVLVPAENAGVRLRHPPDFAARPDGTYLVTGGIDGFGFETAHWLVGRGARSIALLGRRGPETPGSQARVDALAAAGAEVKLYRGDVADRESLAAVLASIRAQQPPLRGIVHAASAIDDGMARDIDAVRAATVLRPKLGGALALDALTREDPIELFLMFSSATTLLGAPGQGIYVGANMALEALARQRRAAGRPGVTVAWGPIADAGYLAARPQMRDALARRLGARPLPAAQALSGLPALIASGLPVAAFAEANWSDARRGLPIVSTPLFSEIPAKAGASAFDEALGDRLAALDRQAALALLVTVVTEEVTGILRLPIEDIDPSRPLSQLGMDSLMAVELRLALENRLRIDLPLMSLAEGTSITSIATRLAAAFSAGSQHAGVMALAARYESLDPSAGDRPTNETIPPPLETGREAGLVAVD
jgi:acyl transferase domain-containing protein/NADPH:quinone reductase-like Zn-dependent oxidoreductase/acyl carrier protein/NAD(P)-dependent dehydrogenase (short-subunit alcohol dehydrogenase family)